MVQLSILCRPKELKLNFKGLVKILLQPPAASEGCVRRFVQHFGGKHYMPMKKRALVFYYRKFVG